MEEYYNYWLKYPEEIKKYKNKDEIISKLEELNEKKVIRISESNRENIKKVILDSNRNQFNLCPGFGLIYKCNKMDVLKLEREGKLENHIKGKIDKCLNLIGRDMEQFWEVGYITPN